LEPRPIEFPTRAEKAFAAQGQEALLEGHVHAFEQLGGVSTDQIRCDNLKSAVSRVLSGRDSRPGRFPGGEVGAAERVRAFEFRLKMICHNEVLPVSLRHFRLMLCLLTTISV
jgi:hypothetical protein